MQEITALRTTLAKLDRLTMIKLNLSEALVAIVHRNLDHAAELVRDASRLLDREAGR